VQFVQLTKLLFPSQQPGHSGPHLIVQRGLIVRPTGGDGEISSGELRQTRLNRTEKQFPIFTDIAPNLRVHKAVQDELHSNDRVVMIFTRRLLVRGGPISIGCRRARARECRQV
jgi:hypothetical protein